MKLISGSSNLEFAQSLSQHLQLPLLDTEISEFPNGEKRILIKEEVKGDNIILVQSFSQPADEHIIETLLLIDALERLGARHINLVIPWMGYSLQDKAFRPGEPLGAKVVADLISNSYVKRVFLLDLHNSSIPGFFSIPTQHITAIDMYVEYVHQTFGNLENFVVASPDFGGLKRARVFADKLNLDLINIDKHRDLTTGKVEAVGMTGTATDKNVLIYDDVINGGSTVSSTATLLKQYGAKSVHFLAAHGPLVPSAHQKLNEAPVDSIVVTNSMTHLEKSANLVVLDVAPLFATELRSWYNGM